MQTVHSVPAVTLSTAPAAQCNSELLVVPALEQDDFGDLAGLDAATCKLLTRRARFEAASDETGAKIVGSYSGSVRWEIPD